VVIAQVDGGLIDADASLPRHDVFTLS